VNRCGPGGRRVEGMSTEIRPVKPDELTGYLKVLPYANGLPHWEPLPAARRAGGTGPADGLGRRDHAASWLHPQAAFADGQLVGGSAMISFEITVPGDRPVPLGGGTSTGGIATHRRQGLLRRMMQAMFDEAGERGEPLAGLSASEGTIYGRYGFGPATRRTRGEIERAQARFRPGRAPDGRLELADAATARTACRTVHGAVRGRRVGELSATPDKWAGLSDAASGPAGPLRYLVHRAADGGADGVASYRLPWSPRVEDTGTLVVEGLQAASDEAYRAMWELLLDFDLTRQGVAAPRPSDEPLRSL